MKISTNSRRPRGASKIADRGAGNCNEGNVGSRAVGAIETSNDAPTTTKEGRRHASGSALVVETALSAKFLVDSLMWATRDFTISRFYALRACRGHRPGAARIFGREARDSWSRMQTLKAQLLGSGVAA